VDDFVKAGAPGGVAKDNCAKLHAVYRAIRGENFGAEFAEYIFVRFPTGLHHPVRNLVGVKRRAS
jgi:hypothetical protein